MSVAKLRLGDFLKEENHRAEANKATIRGINAMAWARKITATENDSAFILVNHQRLSLI
jgi:hypothetical protein